MLLQWEAFFIRVTCNLTYKHLSIFSFASLTFINIFLHISYRIQGVCHISTLLYGSASMFPRLQFSSGEKTGEPKATSSTLVARTRKNFPDRFVLPTDKSLSKHALCFFETFRTHLSKMNARRQNGIGSMLTNDRSEIQLTTVYKLKLRSLL